MRLKIVKRQERFNLSHRRQVLTEKGKLEKKEMEKIKTLGQGAHAVVYEVENKDDMQSFAKKSISQQNFEDISKYYQEA